MSDIDPEKLECALRRIKLENDRSREKGYCTRELIPADSDILEAAARAHLATLPKCKEVEVWHVEYAHDGPCLALYTTAVGAREYAEQLKRSSTSFCVRVTGPHKHLVPA